MITQQELKILFEYENGKLIRKITKGNAKAGNEFGNYRKDGYLQAEINRHKYLIHRLIYIYHHGIAPKFIDHVNGIKSDNRIENLRSATISENNRNSKRRGNSKSGVKNVSWYPNAQKWAVRIYHEGKNKYFGSFDTKEEAETVAKVNRNLLYGEFARDY